MSKEFYREEDAFKYYRYLKRKGFESYIQTVYNWKEQRTVHVVIPKKED